MLEIDGSQGEGGGQILRSSLTLSLVTGQPVRLVNIRAGRSKPGLLRQHLTAVRAAAEVGGARVEGDEVGAKSLTFSPRELTAGPYAFAVGSAGSGTLVLQTVLPALLLAEGASHITIEGGTHNPWAPPFDFLVEAYFPLLQRMGIDVSARLDRAGFYPAGGGHFEVDIQPARSGLAGLHLLQRGELLDRSVTAVVSNLSRTIGQREVDAAARRLDWPAECFRVEEATRSPGPGNVVMIRLQSEHVTELFTSFGRQGTRAERVAQEAVDQVQAYLAADVPVGPYLADQLILPLSLAAWRDGVASTFQTLPLSGHATTHLDIVRQFLAIPLEVLSDVSTVTVRIG